MLRWIVLGLAIALVGWILIEVWFGVTQAR
jgi:hypothetical protein